MLLDSSVLLSLKSCPVSLELCEHEFRCSRLSVLHMSSVEWSKPRATAYLFG